MMDILAGLARIVGDAHVLTDAERYAVDATGKYTGAPLCVVRPADTKEVGAVVRFANDHAIPVVPVGGNTGLVGGTLARGGIMLSLERLDTIREIRPGARIAIVGAGVVISKIHDAVAQHGLIFPLMFGARGSAMIGGCLSTNAGGSNVVRYGNTRALCLGLEVVTPTGEIMDLMSELHKDNSGYDLKDLFIGAEGTLGIITAAVIKLFPEPRAYATAMVAVPSLPDALNLLNNLQETTGGAVEAFEYMPATFMAMHAARFPDARPPFDTDYPVNILVEVGATAPRDALVGPDGSVPVVTLLQDTLAAMMETGAVLDAVVARNHAQRQEMWDRRESSAEVVFARSPRVDSDICLAVDRVALFFERIEPALAALDPGADTVSVAHLGDGNIHYCVYPDTGNADTIMEKIEDVVRDLGGSFSAEHGVGVSKLPSMSRRKDPVALAIMRQIKAALDPDGIMNPGKVIPEREE
jgi:FAD/FMN-containing dehydrogenase